MRFQDHLVVEIESCICTGSNTLPIVKLFNYFIVYNGGGKLDQNVDAGKAKRMP